MKKEDRLSDWEARPDNDHDRNGIDDEIQPPVPDIEAGRQHQAERLKEHTSTSPTLSGGDIDARWEMAESAGEETVAGSAPTPGQSDVDEAGRAMGVRYADDEPLKFGDKERKRDHERWELDPASSDDYRDRAREQNTKERRDKPHNE